MGATWLPALVSAVFSIPVLAQDPDQMEGHIDVAGFALIPKVVTALSYDDNVYRAGTNPLSSDVISINPTLALVSAAGENYYALNLDIEDHRYPSVPRANFGSKVLEGLVRHDFTPRHSLSFDLKAGDLQIGNTSDRDGIPIELTQLAGKGNYRIGREEARMRIDLFGGYSQNDFLKLTKLQDGTDTIDRDIDSISKNYGTSMAYRFMPWTRFLTEASQRDTDYINIPNAGFKITSYLAGLSWDGTGKTSGYVKLGRRYRETDVPTEPTQSFQAWEISVTHYIRPYSELTITTTRDYGLGTSNPEESNLVSGKNLSIAWRHKWSDLFSTSVTWLNEDQEVQNFAGQNLKNRVSDTIDVSVFWDIRRWLKLSISHRFEEQVDELTEFGASGDESRASSQFTSGFERNITRIAIVVTL